MEDSSRRTYYGMVPLGMEIWVRLADRNASAVSRAWSVAQGIINLNFGIEDWSRAILRHTKQAPSVDAKVPTLNRDIVECGELMAVVENTCLVVQQSVRRQTRFQRSRPSWSSAAETAQSTEGSLANTTNTSRMQWTAATRLTTTVGIIKNASRVPVGAVHFGDLHSCSRRFAARREYPVADGGCGHTNNILNERAKKQANTFSQHVTDT